VDIYTELNMPQQVMSTKQNLEYIKNQFESKWKSKSLKGITHHLKILEDAGLIIGKKEGYFTRYYTVEELVQKLS